VQSSQLGVTLTVPLFAGFATQNRIRETLSLEDKAKADLTMANKRVEEQLSAARTDAAQRLADAERLAQSMIEDAKARANDEGIKIVAAAKAEAAQEALKARETLRKET
jgi:F-type H+-transporting ATPase subunit b